MKAAIILLLISIIICLPLTAQTKEVSFLEPSAQEVELWDLINNHRSTCGLKPIPLSKSLCHVAQMHVRDMAAHPPKSPCNLHSWSSYGDWTKVCYTPDHKSASKMWSKPRELTNYNGSGYENAAAGTSEPLRIFNLWKNDGPHNDVIINRGIWSDNDWKAIGVAIYGGYSCMWLGEKSDADGYWDDNESKNRDLIQTQKITSLDRTPGTHYNLAEVKGESGDYEEMDFFALDKSIKPTKKVQPDYPAKAKESGIEGTVLIQVIILDDGRVDSNSIKVIAVKPKGYFEETAIEAAKQWEFTRPIHNGKPVKVRYQIPFSFKL